MGFKGNFSANLVLFSGFFLLSACGKSAFHAQFSYENSSPNIRFEAFDPQGSIEDSKIVSDPLRDQYTKGVWDSLQSPDLKVDSVQSTATSVNRVNIVFIGDGYTQKELANYSDEVMTNTDRFLSQQPFRAYRNYLAFHKVNVVSSVSGVSIAGSVTKRTALEMQYGCSSVTRLLCINLSKASAAAKKAPKVDLIFALANSDRYGGAGYMSPAIATLAARNPATTETALHELGHSFGKLTDEYDYSGTTTDCSKYANTSLVDRLEIAARKSKWFRWLDLANVGSFQGSCYTTKHFRPTANSKMRSLNQPYDEINTEQLIFKIYEKVRPLESATPTATFTTNQILQIRAMDQVETPLEIVWMVDGSVLENLKGLQTLNTADLGLARGTHQISVTVTDRTTRVRDEEMRKKLMSQSISWKLNL